MPYNGGVLPASSNAHKTRFFQDFLGGTFPPARRASDKPIAIACFRLFTFFPDRPLLSVPFFRSLIALFTFAAAFLPYLAIGAPLPELCSVNIAGYSECGNDDFSCGAFEILKPGALRQDERRVLIRGFNFLRCQLINRVIAWGCLTTQFTRRG